MGTTGRSVALAMALQNRAQGRRIVEFRERKGLSQEELARRAGVSKGTVQNWEAGKGIRGENLRRCAEVLDVTPGDIRGDAELPDPFSLAAHLDDRVQEYRQFSYEMRDAFADVVSKLDRQYEILGEILAAIATPEGARVIASGARRLAELAQEAEAPRAAPQEERRARDRRRATG